VIPAPSFSREGRNLAIEIAVVVAIYGIQSGQACMKMIGLPAEVPVMVVLINVVFC